MAHLAHYREAHPLPFRITHWINLICMILLIISGIVIHNGFAFMGMWRGVHIFCGIVIFLNCIVRIVLSFFVKSAPNGGTRETVTDFWTWLPQKSNKHQLISWIK